MTPLPPHCASEGEEIPDLDPELDGPDLRSAMPVDQMLELLSVLDDDHGAYVSLWLRFVWSIGCSVLVDIGRDGSRGLMYGGPCDGQHRHRNRWMHFLLGDLDRVECRRALLADHVEKLGFLMDRRPRNPRETTRAMRDFILNGGRLMLTPAGRVSIGGGVPDQLSADDDAEAESCLRAGRAFLDVRRRFRADPQIARAIRMLGARTSNGFTILEAVQ